MTKKEIYSNRRCRCGCGRKILPNNSTGYFTGDQKHKNFVMQLYKQLYHHGEYRKQDGLGLSARTEKKLAEVSKSLGINPRDFVIQAVEVALCGRPTSNPAIEKDVG